MRFFRTISQLGLVVLGLLNCKQPTIDPPFSSVSACKFQAYQSSKGGKQAYEYNAAGNITKMTYEYRPENGAAQVYVYQFAYNNSNQQATGATITHNGQTPNAISPDLGIGDAVKFTWENNRLVKIVDLLKGKAMLTTIISYDAQGRIRNIKGDADLAWGDSFEKMFTFQPNGDYQYTYLNKETGIQDFYQEVKVNNTIKHAQSLLAAHGLPYDIIYSQPWDEYAIREVTSYDVDAAGHKTLIESKQITNLGTNGNQVLTSQQVKENGKTYTTTYTIVDCD